MTEPIFHITTASEWAAALDAGTYAAPSLADEGFIHASTAAQVPGTAANYYADVDDLVLLVIDPDALTVELRWEESHPDAWYPHLYGPLDVAAVVRSVPFAAEADGTFVVPPAALDLDR